MIQDIKDEILSSDPLYTIRDNSGNVLNDNVDISLKTPITQEGTPINRALFRNLQGDLYTQDKYNKIENITYKTWTADVALNGNILPNSTSSNWTQVNEKTHWVYNSTGAILTTSGSYVTGGDLPIDVFGSGSGWQSNTTTSSWIKLELPKATKITKMKTRITCSNTDYFSIAYIEGSNDDSSWTTLYTITTIQNSPKELTLFNVNYYKYYRIRVVLIGNYRSIVSDWATSEYYGPKSFTDYYGEIDIPLSSYETGKIVNIEGGRYQNTNETYINKFTNPYLNINNLGAKQINGTINYGEKYTLVYNGESWDIISAKVVTGSFICETSLKTINLGFTPDLVICYCDANNTKGVGEGNTNTARYNAIPRILSKAYFSVDINNKSNGQIVDGGFDYIASSKDITIYYIAIKF